MSFKEGERIELKKSLASLKEGLISISAILNKQVLHFIHFTFV